ncbi:hypothetical protein [Rhodohalobacter barkolensis]|uniref:Uncharacterized protein n=1 Tax=Rhodohalobacter barkolensis TaxID=2053187 RepID=A0A2N0VHS0_9BACT|nr:hypothetical protein [Rhodohalobacter barkolensis]PKD43745.1 hypothetical protein CWD77_09305 [Rhodohalobacter barkolensis]
MKFIKRLTKRISLPTPPIGKALRAIGTAIGIGSGTLLGTGEMTYAIMVAATVLVFWISGDLQVAKEFKEIIKQQKD